MKERKGQKGCDRRRAAGGGGSNEGEVVGCKNAVCM